MKNFLQLVTKIQIKIEGICAVVAYILLLAMVFLSTVDVIGRYVFRKPVPSAAEMQIITLIVIVYLSLAYVQSQRAHIVLDSLLEKFGPILRQIIFISGWIMAFVPYIIISWKGSIEAYKAYVKGEFVSGIFHIPTWPGKTCLAIGAIVFSARLLLDIFSDSGKLIELIHKK